MKRLILASLVLAIFIPATALAKAPTSRHNGVYEYVYHHVAHKFGPRVPGRNVLEDGRSDHKPITDANLVASTHTLEQMLVPPPVVTHSYASPTPLSSSYSSTSVPSTTSTYTTQAAPSYSSGGAGGVPACASESGTNYSTGGANTNSSSGATGRYQILPSTAAAYGCSMATPAAQDACAQTIYQHQGASAWVGCGG